MKRSLLLIIFLLSAICVHGQVSSTRVDYTTLNPPTVCSPGHLVTNKTAKKVWLGTNLSACQQVDSSTLGSAVFTTLTSDAADPADAGTIRLGNAQLIEWEKAIPGTDWTLGVNATDQLESTAPLKAPSFIGNLAPAANLTATVGSNNGVIIQESVTGDGQSAPLFLAGTNAAATLSNVSIEAGTTTGANADLYIRTDGAGAAGFGSLRAAIMHTSGNLKLGGSLVVRGTTEGTNHFDVFNGTAPVGTLVNGVSLYSSAGVPCFMDAAGAANCLGQASSPQFTGITATGALNAGTAKWTVNSNGLPTVSNNLTLAGQGHPAILGMTSQKAETTTADANVLTVTPAATVGTYRVCATISVASATSGVISWTLSWTDSNGNAQANIAQQIFQMGTAAPNTTFTTSAAGNYYGCSMIDTNNAAAGIIVKWVGGGTTSAKFSATVERIN